MDNDKVIERLEAEHRQWLMTQHIIRCIQTGMPPIPVKVAPAARPMAEEFLQLYTGYWPIPAGGKEPPDLSRERLYYMIQYMAADGSDVRYGELVDAMSLALNQLIQTNNIGAPYYITEMWYQRTWITLRSEEAMKQEGEFC